MNGSEKQSEWAGRIRDEVFAKLGHPEDSEIFLDEAHIPESHRDAAMSWLRGQDGADFWIDSRGQLSKLGSQAMRAVNPPPEVVDAVRSGDDVRFAPQRTGMPYVRQREGKPVAVFVSPEVAKIEPILAPSVGKWAVAPKHWQMRAVGAFPKVIRSEGANG